MASSSGFKLRIDHYRLPDAMWNVSDRTPAMIYLLKNKGYDCLVTAVSVYSYRVPFMQFMFSTQPISYVLLTVMPPLQPPSVMSRFWTWKSPFSNSVWGTIVASIIVVGLLMAFLEHGKGAFDHVRLGKGLAQGVYLSAAVFVQTGWWDPHTGAGRLLRCAQGRAAHPAMVPLVCLSARPLVRLPASPLRSVRPAACTGLLPLR